MAGLLAQAGFGVELPEIVWSAISPELVLFGVGLLVLLLEVAGESRLQSSFLVFGGLVAGAVIAVVQTGEVAIPGLVALGGAAQFALTALWRDRPRMLSALLSGLGFVATLGVVAWQWVVHADGAVLATDSVIGDMVAVDGVALFTRTVVCIAGLITVPLGFAYLEERRVHRGEYYALLLFAATGMNLLAASADLIMVFIAVEVLSLALYILTGFAKRDLLSQEAALKYFVLGAFSSALLLYGVALVYGVAGTTNIAVAGRALAAIDAPVGISLAALGLLAVGFAFKTALVPFHMWTPDVYQGAPTPVTGFMAAATKAAAFAAFLRVFVGAFAPLQWSWYPVLWIVAVVTMLLGSVLAVVQQDLKRMLAYSAIAHAGFITVGLVAANRDGVSGVLLYLLIYALMSVGAFGVLALVERRDRKATGLDDLRGLGRRYPVPAGMLALFLLSLAGIPGTGGFVAKLAVFRPAVEAGITRGDPSLFVLAGVLVLSSVIAAFFYIRVIVAMFIDELPAEKADLSPLVASPGVSAGLSAAAAGVVVLGIVPGVVIQLASQAASFAG